MKNILVALAMVLATCAAQAGWYDHNNQPRSTSTSNASSSSNQNQSQHQYANSNSNSQSNQSQKAYGGHGGKGGDGGNANSYSNAQGGNAYSKGGNAGAVSGAVSGGNKVNSETNVTVEGDEADKFPVSSAIAGNASDCVEVLAAQAQNGGFSIGGASAECQAEMASRWFYEVGDKYRDSDPEKAAEFYALGDKWAEKAAPGSFQSAVRDTKEVMIDGAVIIGLIRAVTLGF